ncbi:MAG: hypothetical protein DELT_00664 [Desulfovibrio sp.]
MKRRFAIFFCFAFLTLALQCPQIVQASADSPVITKTEWTDFLQRSPALQAADAKLNAAYKEAMAALSPEAKRTLLDRQRSWITARNQKAFDAHAKGSAAYLDMIAAATLEREKELRASLPKSPPAPVQSSSASAHNPPITTPKNERNDLAVEVPPQKPQRKARQIDITPQKFATSYNALAQGFRAPAFPLAPGNVSAYGDTRTEAYTIAEGITVQFKYMNNTFEKPETITFLAHNFLTGATVHRDNIAYALVGMLKTLSKSPAKDDKSRDAEIFGFMHSINNAFTSDTSRVWKNDGLVYVITYLKKNDLFAMVVNVDEKRKQ